MLQHRPFQRRGVAEHVPADSAVVAFLIRYRKTLEEGHVVPKELVGVVKRGQVFRLQIELMQPSLLREWSASVRSDAFSDTTTYHLQQTSTADLTGS